MHAPQFQSWEALEEEILDAVQLSNKHVGRRTTVHSFSTNLLVLGIDLIISHLTHEHKSNIPEAEICFQQSPGYTTQILVLIFIPVASQTSAVHTRENGQTKPK